MLTNGVGSSIMSSLPRSLFLLFAMPRKKNPAGNNVRRRTGRRTMLFYM